MTWNYRLLRHPKAKNANPEYYYAIHEVFYNKKGEPVGWTENPIDIGSEDPSEIKDILTTMIIDVHKAPILAIIKVKGEDKLKEIKLKKNYDKSGTN